VVDGLLAEGCTVLVPTFSSGFAVPAPPDRQLARNAWDYNSQGPIVGLRRVYTPDSHEVDRAMGAVSASVVAMGGHIRGNHPLNSFTSVGPLASDLIDGQEPLDVYAQLRKLVELDGWIVLMGVGLTSMTLLHLAEQRVGRAMFRRWANGPDGRIMEAEVGSCSRGFGKLDPVLAPLMAEIVVGRSHWQVYPARPTLEAAADAIRSDPMITHCGRHPCRCDDAVLGGPELVPSG
jgi:Aminoglycoside 3-N-acetyltransferase